MKRLFFKFCVHCDLLPKQKQKKNFAKTTTKKTQKNQNRKLSSEQNIVLICISITFHHEPKTKTKSNLYCYSSRKLPSGKIRIQNCQNKQKTEIKHFFAFLIHKKPTHLAFLFEIETTRFLRLEICESFFIVFFINFIFVRREVDSTSCGHRVSRI